MEIPQIEKRSRSAAGNSLRPDTRKVLLMQPHDTLFAPILKTCTKCGEVKPLSDFYQIHSGKKAGKYQAKCKACSSVDHAKYRAANLERCRTSDRTYYANNKERAKKSMRAWLVRNPDKRRAFTRRHRQRYPDRCLAHGTVNDAVRRGHIPPAWTMVCERCQEAQAKHWHHHKGYAREFALDVIAVCVDCHIKEHYHE
jgi:hypothetical protein